MLEKIATLQCLMSGGEALICWESKLISKSEPGRGIKQGFKMRVYAW